MAPIALLLVMRLLNTNPTMKPKGLALLEKLQTSPDLALGTTPCNTLHFKDTDEHQTRTTWRAITQNMPFRFIRLVAFMHTLDKLVLYGGEVSGNLGLDEDVLTPWGAVVRKAHADAMSEVAGIRALREKYCIFH